MRKLRKVTTALVLAAAGWFAAFWLASALQNFVDLAPVEIVLACLTFCSVAIAVTCTLTAVSTLLEE